MGVGWRVVIPVESLLPDAGGGRKSQKSGVAAERILV